MPHIFRPVQMFVNKGIATFSIYHKPRFNIGKKTNSIVGCGNHNRKSFVLKYHMMMYEVFIHATSEMMFHSSRHKASSFGMKLLSC